MSLMFLELLWAAGWPCRALQFLLFS